MLIIPLASIEVRKRQRTEKPASTIRELRDSILRIGNIHPPVVWEEDLIDEATGGPIKHYVLLVGECRLEAIKQIAAAGDAYVARDKSVPPGWIAVDTSVDWLNDEQRFSAEFDENFVRSEPSWQDRCKALYELDSMRRAANPSHTRQDTARELVEKGMSTSANSAAETVKAAVAVAESLGDEKVSKARNFNEAYAIVVRQNEDRVNAAIARRQLARMGSTGEASPITLRRGSCLEITPLLEDGIADLILVDPPYGIGADKGGFRARTIQHHNYEDTPESAREIAKCLLLEGFRVAKPRANIFIFHDIHLFSWLTELAARCGWVPFPRPIVWGKSDSEGLAPWGGQGFRLTTEYIFYATKGQRGLISSPIDYQRVNRVSRADRSYGPEKPVELMRRLIECSTLPGDFVLDPCVGSGSSMVAAKQLKRRGLGIELDEKTYDLAMSNVFIKGETSDENAKPIDDGDRADDSLASSLDTITG